MRELEAPYPRDDFSSDFSPRQKLVCAYPANLLSLGPPTLAAEMLLPVRDRLLVPSNAHRVLA